MVTSSLPQLKAAAKLLMKRQNRSYQDLADHLGISLVSVKRIMSKEEVSLGRFLEICEWLETSLTELEKISQYSLVNKKTHFTQEQESFLAKNPEYMSFLFHMYTEETPEQIQKKFGLSNRSLNLYLIRLEKFGILKKVSGQVRLVYRDFPSPIPYGELSKTQGKNVLDSGLSFFKRHNAFSIQRKSPEADKGNRTLLSLMNISRESYLAWFEKYKLLFQELSNVGEIEGKLDIKDKKTVVLLHLHALVDEGDIEIEGIANMFGKPVELK